MVQSEIKDTIVAMATPRGRGGVGIVRVSGSLVPQIAEQILGKTPKVRVAEHLTFLDKKREPLDKGIALFFKGPHSFTGEDVLELQGHGGPVIMDVLLQEVITSGARLAQPGEFSLRAFLNNKIDLLQAEAISDLINASTVDAARGAMRSLQGAFSVQVENVVQALIQLRMYVEAAIDFPEEEIDFLKEGSIGEKLDKIIKKIEAVTHKVRQGALMSDGVKVVIAGLPNAGKSSLLNALSGFEAAIVTEIPGTTRDVLREQISIDGLLVQFIDTAGLREEAEIVEKEGIKRALKEISLADHVVWVVDGSTLFSKDHDNLTDEGTVKESLWKECEGYISEEIGKTVLYNKIDKVGLAPKIQKRENYTMVFASAKTGEGIEIFREHIKEVMGFSKTTEGNFTARRRHLESLLNAQKYLREGARQLHEFKAGELLAEELREAQLALESITGRFTSDDLLGKIFSEFCIGK
jgi:tRNA modification GTPase